MLGVHAARTFGAAALLAGLVVLASALACSLIVGGSPAIVYCIPEGGPGVCASGQICAPSVTGPEHMCTKPCTSSSQCSMGVCDRTMGWCVPQTADVSTQPPDEGSLPDAGAPEEPIDVVTPIEAEGSVLDAPHPCTGFGCRCTKISDCDPRFVCVDKTALPDIDAGVTGSFCASPCCTSVDCDPGDGGGGASVCFATGAGGNYCVPTRTLADRASIGVGGGGTGCMAGSDCRSGLCSDAGTCADTCCSTRSSSVPECANPTVCRFDLFPGSGFDTHLTANCSAPLQLFLGGAGSTCRNNSECQSNLCVSGSPFPGSYCEDPCRNSGDCNSPLVRTCEYYQPDPMDADIVAVCVPNGGADAGVNVCFVDDPNSSNGDCPGQRCRPEPNVMVGPMSYSVLGCGM